MDFKLRNKLTFFLIFIFTIYAFVDLLFCDGGWGTASFLILRIDPGARSSAMGGAFTSISDDLNAFAYNPAGLAQINRREVNASYTIGLENIPGYYIAGALPLRPGSVVGLDFNYMHILEIPQTEVRDESGNVAAGKIVAYQSYGSVCLSHQLIRNLLSLGISAKLLNARMGLPSDSSLGLAFDFGTLVKFGNFLSLGLSLRNLGSKISVGNKVTDDLPTEYSFGTSLSFIPNWRLSFDVTKPWESNLIIRMGTELVIAKMLALRVGYQSIGEFNEWAGFTAGLGFQTSLSPTPAGGESTPSSTAGGLSLRIDYSVTTTNLTTVGGLIHRASTSFRF